jgi:restriction system protein
MKEQALWVVRAGKEGEQERAALENNLVTIGWNEFPDLSLIKINGI